MPPRFLDAVSLHLVKNNLAESGKLQGVPLILETPQERADIAEEDDTPDPWDVRSIALLRALATEPPRP